MLYFKSEERFTSWEECLIELDWTEAEWGDRWGLEEPNLLVNGSRIFDASDYPPDQYVVIIDDLTILWVYINLRDITRYLFMGWPCWYPMTAGRYPICPNDADHGYCYEPIIQSYHVEGIGSVMLFYTLLWCLC